MTYQDIQKEMAQLKREEKGIKREIITLLDVERLIHCRKKQQHLRKMLAAVV